jgi:indole-3-glycerol phosphate synthase
LPTKGWKLRLASTRWVLPSSLRGSGTRRQPADSPQRCAHDLPTATPPSVLTDEKYFQGSDAFLKAARAAVELPVLRKDFVVDAYQLVEARTMGADCVLLIAAALDLTQLHELYHAAQSLGLDVLMEVHDATELQTALSLEATLIGINNRNLKTFETTLETTYQLLPSIREGVTIVTESGIGSRDDVHAMRSRGVNCFLVGEAFMRAADPGIALQEMFG